MDDLDFRVFALLTNFVSGLHFALFTLWPTEMFEHLFGWGMPQLGVETPVLG